MNTKTKTALRLHPILQKLFSSRILPYSVIISAVIILYHSYIDHGFINDDFSLIEKARDNFSLYNSFINQFFTGHFYRPLTQDILYAFCYRLFNVHPASYRIISFIMFIVNSVLVYEIAYQLTERSYAACAASFVYATRAAHSFALYWIAAGFQESGMALFVFLSIFLYLRYTKNRKTFFYIASFVCSILALLSKESGITLPLFIILTEWYGNYVLGSFTVSTALRRIIPFCIAPLLYLSRIYIISTMMEGGFGGFYRMKYSSAILFNNIQFYLVHSFNTYFEMAILGIVIVAAFIKPAQRTCAWFSVLWFCIGLLPFIFLESHLFQYYLSISLAGFSLLVSLGVTYVSEKSHSLRYLLIPILAGSLISSAQTIISRKENLLGYDDQGKRAITIVSSLKHAVPSVPAGSLIYIKNSDLTMCWALAFGSAIRLPYGNTISIYFEGITKQLPSHYSHIYYFNYCNNAVSLIEKSTETK